jgi:hypothetical protein
MRILTRGLGGVILGILWGISFLVAAEVELVDSQEEGDHCSICLEEWNLEVIEESTLICGHSFHRDCIDSWFRTREWSCPLCRKAVERETVDEIEVSTPLIDSVRREEIRAATRILEETPGEDLFEFLVSSNSMGMTALHIAAEHGSVELIALLLRGLSREQTSQLIFLQDSYGDSALHKAVKNEKEASVQILLNAIEEDCKKRKLIKLKNKNKETPFFLALKIKNDELVRFLKPKGESPERVLRKHFRSNPFALLELED